MSADRWITCPKCANAKEQKRQADLVQMKAEYGKMSVKDFLNTFSDNWSEYEKLGEDMREDFEVGMDADSVVRVTYSCRCDKCGYKFNFAHEQPVP